MLIFVALIAVVILFLIFTLMKKRPDKSPPVAHLGIPLIGSYIEFAKNPVSFIERCTDKYGRIFTVPMLNQNLTFLIGPEVSAPFFQLGDDKMSQNEVYDFMTPVFGNGVVYSAEPKKRTQQMICAANGLRGDRLRVYVPKIEKETRNYLKERWGESGTLNLLESLSELTILTSSRCLHGDDVRENLCAEISRVYYDLDKGITPISFFFPYAPIPAHKKRDAARAEMVKIFANVIKERRAATDGESRTDLLQLFIDFVYKEDAQNLTDDQITGLLIALLFAGQHTSSITSTWTTFFLIFNPRCLTLVLEEQERIISKLTTSNNSAADIANTPLDFNIVGEMEYLTNCVKESLRMFPPLIMLMRKALDDIKTTLNGKEYMIPKGDICFTSPAVSARLPDVFKNANDFEPERFGPERGEHNVPFAYLGFGAGRHACIGQQFGILQVKTIMSVLLRNYEIEPMETTFPEADYTAMVVGPKNHLMVRYKKRAGSKILN
jgi:sterol 14alpha-demethylase